MTRAKGAPLAIGVRPRHVICDAGSSLRLRLQLSAPAVVRDRLLNGRSRVVMRGLLGPLHAGMNNVRVKLRRGLKRGAYRLRLDATGDNGVAHTSLRVKIGSKICRAR